MKTMKRKMLIISLLVMCLSLFAGGTLAYFTTIGKARNVVTAGNIGIDVIERDAQGNPFEDVTGVVPGEVIDKIVTVKNTTEANPCWVRIGIEKEILLAPEKSGDIDLSLLELDINEEFWTEEDGYYYYLEAVEPGEETEPLFRTVTFNKIKMGNLYQGCTAKINVEAQAVQSANNGGSVWEAKGWPKSPTEPESVEE